MEEVAEKQNASFYDDAEMWMCSAGIKRGIGDLIHGINPEENWLDSDEERYGSVLWALFVGHKIVRGRM